MNMTPAERMNLLRFVCSFVWTDLKVAQQERDLVMRIAGRLALSDADLEQVKRWLQVPPNVEEVDPSAVPAAHRQLFLQVAELAIKADGRIVPAERDSLALFRDLLQG
ncbi:MAG: TerB family tellurite resistance protein [Planctomycetota bacterium]